MKRLQVGLRICRAVCDWIIEGWDLTHGLHHRFVVLVHQLVAVDVEIVERRGDVGDCRPEGGAVSAAECELLQDTVEPVGQRLSEVSVAGEGLPVLEITTEELLEGRAVLPSDGRSEASAHAIEE